MSSTTKRRLLTAGFVSALVTVSLARAEPAEPLSGVGVFDGHGDIGEVARGGSASYDPVRREYSVTGGGTNMWGARDELHFVWKRMTGDFTLRSRVELVGAGGDPHRKMGWLVRSTLDPASAYADLAVHGDGLTSLQFRRSSGAATEEIRSSINAPDVLQLSRKGKRLTLAVAAFGSPFREESLELDLGDEVYVGLFVCSHDPEVTATAVFRNVRIVVPAPDDLVQYRDYLGSRLEVLDVETGDREIVLSSPDSLQAPNWAPDGKSLIYNSGGRLYRFDLASRRVEEIDTGFATSNNNDHVLSFDGKWLGISHHDAERGGHSFVYVLPAGGGEPRLVTPNGPSYLHGWSPDGKFLIYTGGRDDEYDVYRISVDGGDETNLTRSPGLDDGSEYSPDGEHVYFNSVRSGTMELWRMRPDGSSPEQLTDDEFNNWFPHVSPDGKRIAFLSFSPAVDASAHPFYEHVYLRLLPVDGGRAKVIAYLYGGQGTINVPSWSPDGRRLAFVSNSGEI